MIKALLIVTALSGGGQYTTEMPSMSECLKGSRIAKRQLKFFFISSIDILRTNLFKVVS